MYLIYQNMDKGMLWSHFCKSSHNLILRSGEFDIPQITVSQVRHLHLALLIVMEKSIHLSLFEEIVLVHLLQILSTPYSIAKTSGVEFIISQQCITQYGTSIELYAF